MPRPYQHMRSRCKVCTGKWSMRKFQYLKAKFDKLNPRRVRASLMRLNDPQVQHLRLHYFGSSGKHRTLCRMHVMEFAAISSGKVIELKRISAGGPDFEQPVFDADSSRTTHPSHRRLPPEVDRAISDFLEEHSQPLPRRGGYFLDASFSSHRDVHNKFCESYGPNSPCRTTFLKHWQLLRPDVTFRCRRECACKTCTEFFSDTEKYRKDNHNAGTFPTFLALFFKSLFQCSFGSSNLLICTDRE